LSGVSIKSVTKSFGPNVILQRLDLTIHPGEFMVLVGPSGCGKSTLLRMVAGLEEVTGGTIEINGKVVNDISPKARQVAMVFQNYALYPHMTVRQNMAFSLKLSKVDPAEIDKRVNEAAQILSIEEHLNKKPGQLSGGQKQRVAMGRAMVRNPAVFLFDEPLSNLDAQLRVKMRAEISLLHRRLKSTIIYVTHDQVEAMTLADRIAVMNRGHLEQVGAPLEVYNNPRTKFVASFIGTPSMNFIPRPVIPDLVAPAGAHTVGVRPEATALGDPGGSIRLIKGKVTLIEPLGSLSHVHVSGPEVTVVVECKSAAPALDAEVTVSANPNDLFFFDDQGKRL
jgi:multiple sugar transport system ATP-binding protein